MKIISILAMLQNSKRLSVATINSICTQLYEAAGFTKGYSGKMDLPAVTDSKEDKAYAFEQVQKAFRKMRNTKVDVVVSKSRYEELSIFIDKEQLELIQSKLGKVYSDTLGRLPNNAKARRERLQEYAKDIEALRLALTIGPSQEVADAVQNLTTKYPDIL